MRIRRDPLDALFSEYIRLKAKGECEYCGKKKDFKRLQCSHHFGRRKQSVRFDPDNAAGICFTCHQFLGENPYMHHEWFRKRLGPRRYNALVLRANKPGKPDYAILTLYYKEQVKRLKNEENNKTEVF